MASGRPSRRERANNVHSFYIEGKGTAGDSARLLKEEARHACRVLRLKPGEEFCALDGEHRFLAEFVSLDDGAAEARLKAELPDDEAPVRLTVYQGVAKAEKLELIVQKLAELGAAALVPLRMRRSVAKLDGAARVDRLGRIAREAAKQCRRARALEVAAPLDFGRALPAMARHDLLLVPWEDARGRRLRDAFGECPEARDIGLVIGPEGGIDPEEVERMQTAGAKCVTLGPRILRAETAAIASAALVMSLWGDV